jgi:diadenosine tetraphosphatase ApaH/serine/threonine PP2A family protein phosphatase
VHDLLAHRHDLRERLSMSLSLALFGGVYSNHLALAAVLADIRARGDGAAWCLGDLGGFGPHPERSAARLRASGVPMLQGNYDHSLGHGLGDCGCGYTDPRDNAYAQASYDYTAARTGEETRAWLRGLPPEARFEFGGRRVLLCHGSPRRVNEFLWDSQCSDGFLAWLCEANGADVIACSHTGLPWHRALPGGRQVVNCGAIGRPAHDGTPRVWYAALRTDGHALGVEFRAVDYDHESLAREMEAEALPPEFVETIRTGWWTTCLENVPVRERRGLSFPGRLPGDHRPEDRPDASPAVPLPAVRPGDLPAGRPGRPSPAA